MYFERNSYTWWTALFLTAFFPLTSQILLFQYPESDKKSFVITISGGNIPKGYPRCRFPSEIFGVVPSYVTFYIITFWSTPLVFLICSNSSSKICFCNISIFSKINNSITNRNDLQLVSMAYSKFLDLCMW